MVKKEKYFEGSTKILQKSFFISKSLAKGDVDSEFERMVGKLYLLYPLNIKSDS